jgi:2,3-dimethylmalate lyase
MSKRATRLHRLLADPKILVAPPAYDATGARLVSALVFQALYMNGFETSASILGQPDVGYLTATQMADRVARSRISWTCR